MKSYRDIASDVANRAKDWMPGIVRADLHFQLREPATAKDIKRLMQQLHEYLTDAIFENCQEHSPMPATRDGIVYCELCGKLLEEANVSNNEYPY